MRQKSRLIRGCIVPLGQNSTSFRGATPDVIMIFASLEECPHFCDITGLGGASAQLDSRGVIRGPFIVSAEENSSERPPARS
jgi:hypothetical protein